MTGERKKKRKVSMARRAVHISVASSLILATICILVSALFFQRQALDIYEGMETSLTRSALVTLDQDKLLTLIKKTSEVANSIDNPKYEREHNGEAYFERFSEIQNSEEYKEIWTQLNEIRRSTISTAYCMSLIYPDRGYWIYIFDASDTNVQRCGEIMDGDFSVYIDNPGIDYVGNVTISEKYGRVRTDGVSVYTDVSKNIYCYLTADIPISEAAAKVKVFLLQTASAAFLITALMCYLVFRAVSLTAVKPIDVIANKAEDFVGMYEDRFDTHAGTDIFQDIYKGNVKELIKLSISLRSMELEMNSYLRDIDKLANEKARIGTELDIATRIQVSAIPRNFDEFDKFSQFELYGDMKPAREVGGDFYDFFMLDNDHLCLVMADVSGKGIPAALYMMVSKIAIQTRAEQGGKPSEILAYVNDRLSANNSVDMFVTVWLGILTLSTGKVIAANAGHEFPAITDENGTYSLLKDKHGFVCGGMEGLKYKDYEFTIPKNGKLFLYTDGVPESQNRSEEFFGPERMINALNEAKELSPKETIEHMHEAIDSFSDGAEQFDDTTLLSLWFKG